MRIVKNWPKPASCKSPLFSYGIAAVKVHVLLMTCVRHHTDDCTFKSYGQLSTNTYRHTLEKNMAKCRNLFSRLLSGAKDHDQQRLYDNQPATKESPPPGVGATLAQKERK
jgi:hypothetical protein